MRKTSLLACGDIKNEQGYQWLVMEQGDIALLWLDHGSCGDGDRWFFSGHPNEPNKRRTWKLIHHLSTQSEHKNRGVQKM